MALHYIYKATNKVNEQAYIGLTNGSMFDRMCQHYYAADRSHKSHFANALRKYCVADWEWEVLAECPNRKEAALVEVCLIKAFDTFENGYNMTEGGEGPPKHRSEAHKRNIGKAHKGRPSPRKGKANGPMSEAAKQKLSARMTGRTAWNKGVRGLPGHPMSEENKRKLNAVHCKLTIIDGVAYSSRKEAKAALGLSGKRIRELAKHGSK